MITNIVLAQTVRLEQRMEARMRITEQRCENAASSNSSSSSSSNWQQQQWWDETWRSE